MSNKCFTYISKLHVRYFLETALRSKGLTQRCNCSNYQSLSSLVSFSFSDSVSFPTDWFKGETMRNPHADQYISIHVPYQPFFCKIWKTSDFQTQFNTPITVSSIFDSFLGLNTA